MILFFGLKDAYTVAANPPRLQRPGRAGGGVQRVNARLADPPGHNFQNNGEHSKCEIGTFLTIPPGSGRVNDFLAWREIAPSQHCLAQTMTKNCTDSSAEENL
jgi:hypothetical protein